MFEDPLFWQTEKVFRFTSTVSQKLQAPDLPFHLYSEPKTPGSRPAVSSLQWFRRCRFQAFRFTCRVGQKLEVAGFLFQLYSGSQTRGCKPSVSLLQWAKDSRFQRFSQSAILRWARLQAPVQFRGPALSPIQ